MGHLCRMLILLRRLILKAYLGTHCVTHQQNGSFAQNVDSVAQNVDSEDIPASTNGVIKKDRNNKVCGDRAPPTSTNVLIYKMG